MNFPACMLFSSQSGETIYLHTEIALRNFTVLAIYNGKGISQNQEGKVPYSLEVLQDEWSELGPL